MVPSCHEMPDVMVTGTERSLRKTAESGPESFYYYRGYAAQCTGTSRNGWDWRGTSGSHLDPPSLSSLRSCTGACGWSSHEWDSALLRGELQQVPVSPFLHFSHFKVSLDGRTTPWSRVHSVLLGHLFNTLLRVFFLLTFSEIQNKLTLCPPSAVFWIDNAFYASLLAETEFVVSFWKASVTLQMSSQEKALQLGPVSLTMNTPSEHIKSWLYIKKLCN